MSFFYFLEPCFSSIESCLELNWQTWMTASKNFKFFAVFSGQQCQTTTKTPSEMGAQQILNQANAEGLPHRELGLKKKNTFFPPHWECTWNQKRVNSVPQYTHTHILVTLGGPHHKASRRSALYKKKNLMKEKGRQNSSSSSSSACPGQIAPEDSWCCLCWLANQLTLNSPIMTSRQPLLLPVWPPTSQPASQPSRMCQSQYY